MKTRFLASELLYRGGRMGRLRGLSVLLIAGFFLSFGAAAWAVDLNGTYSDKGTAIATDDSKLAGEVSMHALLTLNLEAAPDVYASTDEVTFTQEEASLEAQILNTEGKVVSKAKWAKDREYRVEENKITLTLRGSGENQSAVLVFQPSSDGKYLEVTVARLTPTTFGPVAQKIGSVVFAKTN
jgi:hypothetical protein